MRNYHCRGVGSSTPVEITGLQVVQQRRSKAERAWLAGAIQRGETKLTDLTKDQVSRLCGVSPQYVHAVERENSAPVVTQLAAE
jgi:hypothetical protein